MTIATLAPETELAERIEAIREFVVEGRQIVFGIGQELSQIRRKKLHFVTHQDFDLFCQDTFGFTGTRGAQLADAAEVGQAIAASLDSDEVTTFFANFNETHARAIKHLPPENQVEAWQTANAVTGGHPTGRVLELIAPKMSPHDLFNATKEEQQKALADVEKQATEAYEREEVGLILKMAARRLRPVAAAFEKHPRAFMEGTYTIEGGLVGVAKTLLAECARLGETG